MATSNSSRKSAPRSRMTAAERREQLIEISRALFAERGFDGTSIEEVASRAEVSKPVVYEHFGGKEGLYAVVVDREVTHLLGMMRGALTSGTSRALMEQAALTLLDYIDQQPDGFRIMVRDSPMGSQGASFQSIIGDTASRVEGILVDQFKKRGLDHKTAPMYAQMLVGMVGTTGQWWLSADRKPDKRVVAAHLVNLAWNGLSGLEKKPKLFSED
ncbi:MULTISPECIES: TetR/AcrR family transcriptional regulator [unclassified Nocardioides]|uniref:TetR/AcrR family transcriptional regulator n=1 Tax=unclassified Nocardioides TaxID=2615069 RepID=UPI0007146069|nr:MULTISPECIES: TetR/AcrR family transcriptional regulator [unclassified Nocardioides]KQY56754.1 TetR family transcriptional regulator [Nocardioides sp. Root140]KQZ67049.1 TetR family transcriptional regulator [Nocardioides sp. Root151]